MLYNIPNVLGIIVYTAFYKMCDYKYLLHSVKLLLWNVYTYKLL